MVTRPGPAWMKFITEARIRSTLRVPIRSQGPADRRHRLHVTLGRRVRRRRRDRRLAHRRPARARTRPPEARGGSARKTRMAALDAVLPQLEALDDVDDIAVTVSRLARGIIDHDAVGVLVSHSEGGHDPRPHGRHRSHVDGGRPGVHGERVRRHRRDGLLAHAGHRGARCVAATGSPASGAGKRLLPQRRHGHRGGVPVHFGRRRALGTADGGPPGRRDDRGAALRVALARSIRR